MAEPEQTDPAQLQARIDLLNGQISKLSKITEIIAEGTFFYYHPREEDSQDSSISQLASNFNRMIAQIQDHQQNLEEKVSQRTAELQETLSAIERLKLEQDGDYFLTSELLQPFGSNRSNNDHLDIELFTRQKKRFKYRKWDRSIGGDISGSSDIELNGEPFTFFFNADAMGKSIPGAGGALVLGAVTESIVQRTRLSSSRRSMTPESWLRESFLEIEKVFEGFDGSTMITMIVGLVDQSTGTMYWINADHPLPVLLREGKAMFLKAEYLYNKVGLKITGGPWEATTPKRYLSISTLRLRPGDVMLCGSDGKDDLVMGEDENGYRIISSDTNVFRRVVEENAGDIDKIVSGLEREGDLMDDLSLLRLHFRGPGVPVLPATAAEEELHARFRDAPTREQLELLRIDLKQLLTGQPALIIYKFAGQLERKLGQYRAAQEYLETYAGGNPADFNGLYLLMKNSIRIGRNEMGLEICQRLLARQPDNVRLQLQAVALFIKLDRSKEARRAFDDIDRALLNDELAQKKYAQFAEELGLDAPALPLSSDLTGPAPGLISTS